MSLSHSPLPWTAHRRDDGWMELDHACDGGLECRLSDEDAEFIVRAVNCHDELLEAMRVVTSCGEPSKVLLYDEEGIEGWRWTHPDGREWEEAGDWGEPAVHPIARAAIRAAEGGEA